MVRQFLALCLLVSLVPIVLSQDGQTCACKHKPRDCQDLQDAGNTESGVYTIFLNQRDGVRVWCDMDTDGGGWTVFQKRVNGSTDFYRGWDEYAIGFGNPGHEYWLGNQHIHYLTSSDWYKMRVDLEDFDNNTRYAQYDIFSVGNAEGRYKAFVSGYTGNAGNDMSLTSGYRFSTKDRDYDACNCHCARSYHGGWWYAACHRANLNGKYLSGRTSTYANGVVAYSFKGYYYSLKSTKMMVRRGWHPSKGQIVSV